MESRKFLFLVILGGLSVVMGGYGGGYEQVAPSSLRQVFVVMRHGKRAILKRTSPSARILDNETHWDLGYGELMPEGMRMQDNLGRWFRHRYDRILDSFPKNNQVAVYSTDIDRTLNSAQANMAGLFYLKNESLRYNPELPYAPVPIHTIPVELDTLIRVDVACPGIEKEFKFVLESEPVFLQMLADNELLVEELGQKLETEVKTLADVQSLYDDISILKNENFTIPNWLEDQLPRMKNISGSIFQAYSFNDHLKRMRTGPVIEKIFGAMSSFQQSPNGTSPVFTMFSGHDVTVASHLNTLGFYNGLQPPYASAVIYELHEDPSGNFSVEMFFHNDTTFQNGPHRLVSSQCNGTCTFDGWQKLVSPYFPGPGFRKDCMKGISHGIGDLEINIIIVVASLAVLVVVATFYFIWHRKERGREHGYAEIL